jgi:hypothetical protein
VKYSKIVRWGLLIKLGMFAVVCVASRVYSVDVAKTQELPQVCHSGCDLQYFAPDPEFKLSREQAALAQQRASEICEAPTPELAE